MCGKPVGTMNVSDYHAYLDEARRQVRRAYDSLAAECEVVVLEGAGSPAEVNLRDSDIVNMDMAAYARSPVVLVGDIDRGGVFAALVGTMTLLTPRDRRLVAGYVLNKFRGEPSLLGEALERTTMLTGIPCWGVVPFIPQLGLPDEDSVAFKGERTPQWTGRDERVRIALVDLPHISNVSDFDPFKAEPDVEMRVVRSLEDFDAGPDGQGEPDVVMLPGSKNTLADLSYLRGTGLAERIAALARSGKVEVVGVCGGFQMLGGTIADPLAVESAGPAAAGLGLLPFDTVMAQEKTLRLVRGRHLASAMEIHGYEIHHGRSELRGAQGVPVVAGPDGEGLGLAGSGGLVWGTYLHGLFDADGFRRWFIDNVRLRKGMEPLGRVMAAYDLEPALENLARVVRESIDVGAIYRRIGLR